MNSCARGIVRSCARFNVELYRTFFSDRDLLALRLLSQLPLHEAFLCSGGKQREWSYVTLVSGAAQCFAWALVGDLSISDYGAAIHEHIFDSHGILKR